MTKEKQIEEMAKVYYAAMMEASVSDVVNGKVSKYYATKFYNAGYRKQSVGEWKQTKEPLGWHDVDCVECSACGESWVLGDNLDYDLIEEYWHFCPNCGAKMKGGE